MVDMPAAAGDRRTVGLGGEVRLAATAASPIASTGIHHSAPNRSAAGTNRSNDRVATASHAMSWSASSAS